MKMMAMPFCTDNNR